MALFANFMNNPPWRSDDLYFIRLSKHGKKYLSLLLNDPVGGTSALKEKLNKILWSLEQLRPASFFLVAALFFELCYNIVTPPLQAPDEFSHFYRAYQIAEGHFLPEKKDQRLGGMMPQGMIDFCSQYRNSAYIIDYTLTHREILRSCKIKLQDDDRHFQDFANTSYYSAVSYLPQALAIFILKLFDLGPAALYYGGRLFSFLMWLLLMYLVIKQLPAFRWLFTIFMLLPMQLYSVNSFSADTVTNLLSFWLMGRVLTHTFGAATFTWKDILIVSAIAVLLVLAKVVYVGLLLLVLIIPRDKYNNTFSRFAGPAFIFVCAFITVLLWSGTIMQYYIPVSAYNPQYREVASISPCGDYYAQQHYILTHGFYFLKVIVNSLFRHPHTYLSGYIGVFGNGDIGMPTWLYTLAYVFICLVSASDGGTARFKLWQKLLLFSGAALALVLLLLSQHLIWDCVGEGIVDLLQGRYLIPVFPLIFLLFVNVFRKLHLKLPITVLLLIVFLNLFALVLIANRFFIGKAYSTTEYFCDAEQLDAYGAFNTSNPSIYLNSANCQTASEHRSGRFSALLSPASPYCFTYKLNGLKSGDIIEVEAWEKKKGALLVVSEKKTGCGEQYFAGTYNSFTDKNGWRRIKNVYQLKLNCDSSETAIYVWNPNGENNFIDDLKVRIKKYK